MCDAMDSAKEEAKVREKRKDFKSLSALTLSRSTLIALQTISYCSAVTRISQKVQRKLTGKQETDILSLKWCLEAIQVKGIDWYYFQDNMSSAEIKIMKES